MGQIKRKLSLLLKIDENDIRLYENLSYERRKEMMTILEERMKELIKLSKKSHYVHKISSENEMKALEIPPIPNEKKVYEIGLKNEDIVFFVYRTRAKTGQSLSIYLYLLSLSIHHIIFSISIPLPSSPISPLLILHYVFMSKSNLDSMSV
jgi:hypothetical protein